MRDAMSLLDQVIAFSGTKLTGDGRDARPRRGRPQDPARARVGALAGDAAACLGVVERLAQQGFDLAARREGHAATPAQPRRREGRRGQATARAGASRELLDLADEEAREVVELSPRSGGRRPVAPLPGVLAGFDDMVRSGQPRTALEMALVRLARRPPLLPLDELLSRVGDLEKRLGGAGPRLDRCPAAAAVGAGRARGPARASNQLLREGRARSVRPRAGRTFAVAARRRSRSAVPQAMARPTPQRPLPGPAAGRAAALRRRRSPCPSRPTSTSGTP